MDHTSARKLQISKIFKFQTQEGNNFQLHWFHHQYQEQECQPRRLAKISFKWYPTAWPWYYYLHESWRQRSLHHWWVCAIHLLYFLAKKYKCTTNDFYDYCTTLNNVYIYNIINNFLDVSIIKMIDKYSPDINVNFFLLFVNLMWIQVPPTEAVISLSLKKSVYEVHWIVFKGGSWQITQIFQEETW